MVPMTYFGRLGEMPSWALLPVGKEDRPERPRTAGGSFSMNLEVFKAWLKAKLNVTDERGANMVEYVLILTLIAIVVILIVTQLGGKVSEKFSKASSGLG